MLLSYALAFFFFIPTTASAASINISSIDTLSFGKLASGSGGTVTIAPNGSRSALGGVALLTSGAGSAAHFLVTGDPGFVFNISLPGNGEVTLSSGAHSIPITNFTLSPTTPSTLDGTGKLTLAVGGTLNVDSGKQAGDYSGTFNIIVDYQ